MVLHWRLGDSKFPQVSRTFLSILADLNSSVIWMVSNRPLTSKSFILCTNHLVTVLSTLLLLLILLLQLAGFSHQLYFKVFQWILSNSKSPQVSWTLLGILADFNNAIVLMVSARPPISYSSSWLTNLLEIVPGGPITIIYSMTVFQYELMVFYWSLSDSKSPQESRTLLSILADLNNVVVWIVSSRPFISKFSSLDCTKSTHYNWYKRHFYFPQFFQFPSKVKVFILLFTFFQFYSVVNQDCKVYNFASSLFLYWLF